jgi:hypothetical protein
MDKLNSGQDNDRMKKYKRSPNENLKDSIDKSITGDMNSLSKVGCLPALIIIAIITVLFIFSRLSQ